MRFCPAWTVLGAVLLAIRSAKVPPLTIVTAVLLLFSSVGSNVVLDTVATLVKTVPAGVPFGMAMVDEKLAALLPAASDGLVHDTVPLVPTAGVVQVQPAGEARLTKFIPGGSGSDTVTLVASSGPPLSRFSE